MAFKPCGIVPAMVTPLTPEGRINEAALRKFTDYLIEGGSHGLFVVGTTGEFYGLSAEEKRELFRITVDQVKGRVPVYAGTGAIDKRHRIPFRYHQTGSPFEYDLLRMLYTIKREFEVTN